MLYRDTQGSRQLAAERDAELKRDRHPAAAAAAAPVATRSDLRARLAWLRVQLRSTGTTAARHAS